MNKDRELEISIKKILNRSEDYHDIFTPLELCDEMLDKLPELNDNQRILVMFNLEFVYKIKERIGNLENVWFLTPCDLKGRVANSLGIPENQVIKISYKNINIDDMPKFDVVVANPPYQNYYGNSKNAEQIYTKFVQLGNKIGNINLQIFPTKGFIQERNNKFRKNIFNHGVIKLECFHEDYVKQNLFKEVIVRGGLSILYSKKGHFSSNVDIIDHKGNKKSFKNIDLRNNYEIIKYNNKIEFYIIKKIRKCPNSFKDKFMMGFTNTNEKYFKNTKESDNDIKIFVSKNKSKEGYKFMNKYNLSKNKIDLSKKWKVMIPLLENNINNIYICNPNEIFSYTYVGFIFENENELNNFLHITKLNLIKYIFFLEKRYYNQNTGQLFKNIPLPSLNKKWTNEELYEYFNLTQEEIDYIESQVK